MDLYIPEKVSAKTRSQISFIYFQKQNLISDSRKQTIMFPKVLSLSKERELAVCI
jgi:hypothetical protein